MNARTQRTVSIKIRRADADPKKDNRKSPIGIQSIPINADLASFRIIDVGSGYWDDRYSADKNYFYYIWMPGLTGETIREAISLRFMGPSSTETLQKRLAKQ